MAGSLEPKTVMHWGDIDLGGVRIAARRGVWEKSAINSSSGK
ncbi:Wadjet anti-phage system protein JetD domain-containing protein [Marinobacter antarcticus]